MVIDVVLDEVVKKEVTKLVEEVNKVMFKEGRKTSTELRAVLSSGSW